MPRHLKYAVKKALRIIKGKFDRVKSIIYARDSLGRQNPYPRVLQWGAWVATVLAPILPLHLKFHDGGYYMLEKSHGFRRFVTYALHLDLLLQTIFATILIFHEDFVGVTPDGMLTVDAMLYLLIMCLMWAGIKDVVKLDFDGDIIIDLLNYIRAIIQSFSDDHLDGRHIVQLNKKHIAVRTLCLMILIANSILPALSIAVAVVIGGRSPMQLTYYIERAEGQWYGTAFFWCLAMFNDWMIMAIVSYILLSMMGISGGCMIEMMLFLRMQRRHNVVSLPWRTKLRYHAQLEITFNIINEVMKILTPVVIFEFLLASVLGLVLVVKMDIEALGLPLPLLIPVFLGMAIGPTTFGICIIRQCDLIRIESLGFVDELGHQGALEENRRRLMTTPQLNNSPGRRVFPLSFRRRPIGIRLGIFMIIDAGMSVDFLQAIFDNSVAYIFMVDTSYPTMLI